MERREEIQKRIDDKLLGRNTAAEQRAFDEELAENDEVREAYGATIEAMTAIEVSEDQAMKQRLQALEKKLAADHTASPLKVVSDQAIRGKVVPFYRKHFYALAASLLFLLAAGYFILLPSVQQDSASLYAANFEPYRNIAVDLTRGNDPTPEEIAFSTYESGDYQAALSQLKSLEKNPVYDFYVSQCQLALGEYDRAIDLLTPLSNAERFPLRQQANWFLGLAYLGNGDAERAEARLKDIAANVNHPFQEQAVEILAALN